MHFQINIQNLCTYKKYICLITYNKWIQIIHMSREILTILYTQVLWFIDSHVESEIQFHKFSVCGLLIVMLKVKFNFTSLQCVIYWQSRWRLNWILQVFFVAQSELVGTGSEDETLSNDQTAKSMDDDDVRNSHNIYHSDEDHGLDWRQSTPWLPVKTIVVNLKDFVKVVLGIGIHTYLIIMQICNYLLFVSSSDNSCLGNKMEDNLWR